MEARVSNATKSDAQPYMTVKIATHLGAVRTDPPLRKAIPTEQKMRDKTLTRRGRPDPDPEDCSIRSFRVVLGPSMNPTGFLPSNMLASR